MGTGAFAVPSFEKLLRDKEHEIIALVTMPVRVRPGVTPVVSPMQQIAEQNDILVFAPPDVNAREFVDFMYLAAAEVFFVCDFGKILKPATLKASRLGGINLHGSLLPRYRGAAPVHWAILNGDSETGVSVIHMTAEVDAGPVVAKSDPIPIGSEETVIDVERQLAELGAGIVARTLTRMETGRLPALPQMPHEVSRAPKLKKNDGLIDWTRSARFIRDHYRAMHPWPGSYTFWHSPEKEPVRLGLGPFTVFPDTFPSIGPMRSHPPGMIVQADRHGLLVATGDGLVRIEAVLPAGKKLMDALAFMRGYPVRPGDRFGEEHP